MADRKIGFPKPHVVLTEKGVRVNPGWTRLEGEAERRSPKLGARVRGMRERAVRQLERDDLSNRVDSMVEMWQKEHPGEPVPWQIGG